MKQPEDDFAAALAAYEAGRLEDAAALLRAIPEDAPRHADALNVLGLIALRSGDGEEAERLIGAAIARDGANPAYRGNLAAALHRQGRFEAAVESLREALAAHPDYHAGYANLGVMLVELGRAEEAIEAFRNAIDRDPANAAAHFGLGNALFLLRRWREAADSFRAAIASRPGFTEAHNNLGNALTEQGDPDGAVTALEAASALRPGDAQLRLNLGQKYRHAGRTRAAQAAFKEAVNLDPKSLPGLAMLADIALLREGDAAAALELNDRIIALAPESAEAHAERAFILERMHRLDEAAAAAEKALYLDVDDSLAHCAMARVERRRGRLEEARSRLELILAEIEVPIALLELGQVLDELDRPAAAFDAFRRGKDALKTLPEARPTDPQAYRDWVRRGREAVSGGDVAHWPREGAGGRTPFFLVGFPRSGVALLGGMLARHPAIVGVAEQPILRVLARRVEQLSGERRPYPDGLASLPPEAAAELRREYWRAVDRAGGISEGTRLLDRLALNIVYLPLVRRVFPEAKVLVALRDPRDVVLSCFMQIYRPTDSVANFNDIESAARLYEEAMELWFALREHAGLDCLECHYEDVIGDPRAALTRVVAHLGVGWDECVLDSGAEEPLHGRAIGRWRRYRDELVPVLPRLARFVAALGYPPN